MLRLTREAEYGLMAMTYIASQPDGELAYRKEIASHHRIPREFLAKVLQKLSRGGLIRSSRGIRGGYLLAKRSAEISLADVVRAVDGPMAIVECARKGNECPQFDSCNFRDALWELQDSIVHVLTEISLHDFARRVRERGAEVLPLQAAKPGRRAGFEGNG